MSTQGRVAVKTTEMFDVPVLIFSLGVFFGENQLKNEKMIKVYCSGSYRGCPRHNIIISGLSNLAYVRIPLKTSLLIGH